MSTVMKKSANRENGIKAKKSSKVKGVGLGQCELKVR